jgi:endonuclease/exonuclease/phosphatase family metal-dependent hydrolase
MRLVSLNTWKAEGDYPRRIHAMAEGLLALDADVVALQEDLRTSDGLTHTALVLAQSLSMHLAWAPARLKQRQVALRRTATTSGLAVLSRQPVLEQQILALPEDPGDGERVAQCVRLSGDGGDWWLANVHLTHLPDRADLRRAQLQAVLSGLDGWAGDQPAVLCGDFNAAPGDPEIAACLPPHGPWTDAFAGRIKVTHIAASGQPCNLDHIFLRARAGDKPPAAGSATVALDRPGALGVVPSDHFAVCADLSL